MREEDEHEPTEGWASLQRKPLLTLRPMKWPRQRGLGEACCWDPGEGVPQLQLGVENHVFLDGFFKLGAREASAS